MRTAALSALLVFLAVLGALHLGPAIAVAETPSPESGEEPWLVYDVALEDDGTAHWNISAHFPVETTEEQEAFDSIAAAFEADDGDEYLSVDPYVVAAGELEDDLDRPMTVHETNRSVNQSHDVGVLWVTFEWSGFAQATNETVTVGDVFATTDRPWLSTLNENEQLRIHAPDGYLVESSGMPVSERTVWMDGPADLGTDELSAVFRAERTGGDEDPPDGSNGDDPDGSILAPLAMGAAGVLAALLVLGLVGYLAGAGPVVAAVHAVRSADTDGEPQEEPIETEEASADPIPEAELLSDEERVLHLIDRNGGRMKQADIVTETDWSNAKVSQLLSEMADDGDVEKLRIGRENLISLPDADE